jgi:hypothetical protein
VLFGAAEREDAPVILFQVSFDLHPVHVGDFHGAAPVCDADP